MTPTAVMAPCYPKGTFDAEMQSLPESSVPSVVLTISSNKGGVGKTTVASNLAIYLRALREDLPVLLVGLDDQRTLDRMFQLREPEPGEPNLKHGWAERTLSQAVQLGQYGVHFVPSPPDLTVLKARAEDPNTLGRILERTEWPGVVILDTKSDLEALTKNAYHAADRILIPVSDRASLEEATKIFHILDKSGLPRDIARVLFTLVDRRTRLADGERHLFRRLLGEAQARDWPYYKTYLSRSPRVESLNSGTGTPLSILHHGKGTAVYDQLRALALEVLQDLDLSDRLPALVDEGPDELWGRRAEPPRPESSWLHRRR
jgi:cellulose biosynthesis protein BcsQ